MRLLCGRESIVAHALALARQGYSMPSRTASLSRGPTRLVRGSDMLDSTCVMEKTYVHGTRMERPCREKVVSSVIITNGNKKPENQRTSAAPRVRHCTGPNDDQYV